MTKSERDELRRLLAAATPGAEAAVNALPAILNALDAAEARVRLLESQEVSDAGIRALLAVYEQHTDAEPHLADACADIRQLAIRAEKAEALVREAKSADATHAFVRGYPMLGENWHARAEAALDAARRIE